MNERVPMPSPANDQAPQITDYPDLARLYDHWVDRFADAPIPAWSAFDPVELRPWMGRLNLVDVTFDDTGTRDFVYRVFGSDLAEMLNREMTGLSVGEGVVGLRDDLLGDYEEVVDAATPILRHHESSHRTKVLPHVRLMLPLGAGGCEVTRILVGVHPLWLQAPSPFISNVPADFDAEAIFGAQRLRVAAR